MIDLYCERTGPGLFAEPVNTLTNAAFLVAAWAAWRLARRSHGSTTGIRTLITLAVAIGIGSSLFHALATGWARLLDELPILLFQLAYLWLYARHIMGVRAPPAAGLLAAYLAAAFFGRQFPLLLNGSLVYAPALLLMLALGIYHLQQARHGRFLVLAMAGIFAVSLVFRTLDSVVCEAFPVGSHFLWHLLNAGVLYLAMRVLIVNRA